MLRYYFLTSQATPIKKAPYSQIVIANKVRSTNKFPDITDGSTHLTDQASDIIFRRFFCLMNQICRRLDPIIAHIGNAELQRNSHIRHTGLRGQRFGKLAANTLSRNGGTGTISV